MQQGFNQVVLFIVKYLHALGLAKNTCPFKSIKHKTMQKLFKKS